MDVDKNSNDDDDLATWAAYRKAKERGEKQKAGDGGPKKERGKAKWYGRTLSGTNMNTGLWAQCYRSESEYRLLPKFPLKNMPPSDAASLSPFSRSGNCPPYSSISLESPANVLAGKPA